MADNEVQMDIPATQTVADGFRVASGILKEVDQALSAAMLLLRTTAFFGLVGGIAVEAYIERIQPVVKRLAEKFEELHYDVVGAIIDFRDGDQSGSERFR